MRPKACQITLGPVRDANGQPVKTETKPHFKDLTESIAWHKSHPEYVHRVDMGVGTQRIMEINVA